MDALPPEILKLILCYTFDSCNEGALHLRRALQVCKRWNTIAGTILWRSTILNGTNTRSFLRTVSPARRSLIRNLTVSTNTLDAVRKRKPSKIAKSGKHRPRVNSLPPSAFRRLLSCIKNMNHLTTLSLHDDGPGTTLSDTPVYVSEARVQLLLDNLPTSVKNLEIDIRHCDDVDLEAQSCLSRTIARRLSSLEYVRLRIPKLCPSLLASSCTLKSMTVNISWMDMYNTCSCRQSFRQQPGTSGQTKEDDDRSLFIQAAESFLDRPVQAFPSIEQFTLTSTYNSDEDWCGPSHLMLKDDLISKETTAYPLWCVNEDAPVEHELWAMRVKESDDPDARDIIGSSTLMEEYVENPTWSQDLKGGRYVLKKPVLRQNKAAAIDTADHTSILRAAYSESCGVWFHEKHTNSCLIAPQTARLGDTPKIDMNVCEACADSPYCHAISHVCNVYDHENGNNLPSPAHE